MADWVQQGLHTWNNMDFCHTCKTWVAGVSRAEDECPQPIRCPECNKVLFEAETRRRRRWTPTSPRRGEGL